MLKRVICFLSAVMVAASSAFASGDIPWTVWSGTELNFYAYATSVDAPGSDISFLVGDDGSLSESYVEIDYNRQSCPYVEGTSSLANGQFIFNRPSVVLQGTHSALIGKIEHNYSFPSLHVNQHQVYVTFPNDILQPGFYEVVGSGFCELFAVESGTTMYSLGSSLVASLTSANPDSGIVDVISFLPDPSFGFRAYVEVTQSGILALHFGFSSASSAWSGSSDSVSLNLRYVLSSLSLKYRSVDPADVAALNQANQDASNSMQDYDSTEQQFTQSMTDNFNALNLSDFTFPSGLLSGFTLVTSLFEQLWNGLGEYKILYVFPLTLGIVLLLIGRISKSSGGQSSRLTDRGDDDA